MKYTWVLLLAGIVARPAQYRAIVHFRDGLVGQQALRAVRCVLVLCLRHVYHFDCVIECPSKIVWWRVSLDLAGNQHLLVLRHPVDTFLLAHAYGLVCNELETREKSIFIGTKKSFHQKVFLFLLRKREFGENCSMAKHGKFCLSSARGCNVCYPLIAPWYKITQNKCTTTRGEG